MEKSNLIKVYPKFGYTAIIRYKRQTDVYDSIGYYYLDYYEPKLEDIRDYFHFGNGDDFQIWECRHECFFYDDYLSDEIVEILICDEKIECDNRSKKGVEKIIAYIIAIYEKCHNNKKERREYAKNVLTSVLKYLDLRKQNPIASYVASEILNIFNAERDDNLNVREQIKLFLEPKGDDSELYLLVKEDCVRVAQRHLDRIGEAYKITEEKSLYRIGVLFLRIHKAFSESRFLRPRFIKDKDKAVSVKKTTSKNTKKHEGEIRHYSEFMELLASYYGISKPTYRELVLRDYREKGERYTLYSLIKTEHMDIWNSIY